MNSFDKCLLDLITYGSYVMKDGKHVKYTDRYKCINKTLINQAITTALNTH